MKKQFTALNQANGRIVRRFHARDLHLVMGPAARGGSVRFRALIDGQPLGARYGIDVDDQGSGAVTEQRLIMRSGYSVYIENSALWMRVKFSDDALTIFLRIDDSISD